MGHKALIQMLVSDDWGMSARVVAADEATMCRIQASGFTPGGKGSGDAPLSNDLWFQVSCVFFFNFHPEKLGGPGFHPF